MTKKEIEDILYQWKYFQQEEEKYKIIIEEYKTKIIEMREKYPQSLKEKTYSNNKTSSITEKTAINIIDSLEKKVNRIINNYSDNMSGYIIVKNALKTLSGYEKELIRLKYIEKYRGEKLYSTLNYTKRGYYYKQKSVLNKIIVIIFTQKCENISSDR